MASHTDAPIQRCAECSSLLTEVRPGKYTCDLCEVSRVIDSLKQQRDTAYRRGAEVMREAAALLVRVARSELSREQLAEVIRELPVAE